MLVGHLQVGAEAFGVILLNMYPLLHIRLIVSVLGFPIE